MVLDTIDINFLPQRFDPNGLAVAILDDFFFIQGDELIQLIITNHLNSCYDIRRPDGHTTIHQDQQSLNDLSSFLTIFFLPNDLDNFCSSMDDHIQLLLHQTQMTLIGSKQMEEIIWMT